MNWKEIIDYTDHITEPNDIHEVVTLVENKRDDVTNKSVIIDVEVQKIARVIQLLSVPTPEFDCLVDSMNKIKKTCMEMRE